jgi:DNA-directed RNA polymerase beta' subunit
MYNALYILLTSCTTCHLTYYNCPGHFGHIELPAPVFHPLFMVNMYNLLRATCLFCHQFKLSRTVVRAFHTCIFDRFEPFVSYVNTSLNFGYWSVVC